MATTMDSYILRIYRLDRKKPQHLVGLVEKVGVKEKKPFTNLQELWDILRSTERRAPVERKSKKEGRKDRRNEFE